MSLNKINKEFKKLYRLYKNTDISRETIIFSESKGFSLRHVYITDHSLVFNTYIHDRSLSFYLTHTHMTDHSLVSNT